MRDPHLEIRPAGEAEHDDVIRIFDVANPAWATSAAHHRRQRAHRVAPKNGIVLVAERDGRLVGAARASESLEGLLPQPGNFSARVAVDPGAAGHQIGGRLWQAVTEWIQPQDPNRITSWVDRDDDRSVAIAGRWGFRRRPGSIEDPEDPHYKEPWAWEYELMLAERGPGPQAAPPLPRGTTLSPLSEVLDDPPLLASLHEAHEECRADVPAWERYEPKSSNDFGEAQRERIGDSGAGLVLHHKHEVLAATFVQRAAFVAVAHSDFTMVRRSARGQGLALELKRRLLDRLEKDGLERVTTEVRTDNPAMLAVNTTLGFRRIGMRHITSGRDL